MEKAKNLEEFFIFIDSFSGPFQSSQLSSQQTRYELAVTITDAFWKIIDYAKFNHPFTLHTAFEFFVAFFKYHEAIFGHQDDQSIRQLLAEYDRISQQIPVAGTILFNHNLTRVLYVVQNGSISQVISPPRGKRNQNESPIATAIRECEEETGLDVVPFILENEYITFHVKHTLHLFIVVTPLSGFEELPLPQRSLLNKHNSEISSLQWIDVNSLPHNIRINRAIPALLYQWTLLKLQNPNSNQQETKNIYLRPIRHSNGKVYHFDPSIEKQFNSVSRHDHSAWDNLITQNQLRKLTITRRFRDFMSNCSHLLSLSLPLLRSGIDPSYYKGGICYDVYHGEQIIHKIAEQGELHGTHGQPDSTHRNQPNSSPARRRRSPSGGNRDGSPQPHQRSTSRRNSKTPQQQQQQQQQASAQPISLDDLFGTPQPGSISNQSNKQPQGQVISLDDLFSAKAVPSPPPAPPIVETVVQSQPPSPSSQFSPSQPHLSGGSVQKQPENSLVAKNPPAVLSTDQYYQAFLARQQPSTTPSTTRPAPYTPSPQTSSSLMHTTIVGPPTQTLLSAKLNTLKKTQEKTPAVTSVAK